ncbi:YuzD family protein [Bacillus sp. NPDC093026]|uniref:YuzD family protein n=1 Tax=Bacillus sp. NPDC093026 TaxID=3363948 RepID=UPI0038286DCE
MNQIVDLYVYGRDVRCASCVNLPSSKDTYEWLAAALKRKYPNQPFRITYVDIEQPPENERQKELSQRILEDEFFYPLVLVEDQIVGEGNPRLKDIDQEMKKYGYKESSE